MIIDINNCQNNIEITEQLKNLVEQCVLKTLEAEGIDVPIEISILLVDNKKIRELNRQYRGKDASTDVLSFPMLEFEDGDKNKILSQEIDRDSNAVILGDIVLSMEKAGEQAEEYGHGLFREIGFLIVHSLLHLLGYDHENHEDTTIMRKQEKELMNILGLPRSK